MTERKETGKTETISGVVCAVVKERFTDVETGKPLTAWSTAYRFTVPGWDECTINGKRAAERVINGRLNAAVRNTLGIK